MESMASFSVTLNCTSRENDVPHCPHTDDPALMMNRSPPASGFVKAKRVASAKSRTSVQLLQPTIH